MTGRLARPSVTVVIGAYSREQFLRAAVDSVIAQTLDRGEFEVIVIKNFSSEALDQHLSQNGVTVLSSTEPLIGRFFLQAVDAAHAPFIAFLDDDDQFEPERLARAVEVLSSHPNVGFYRNRVRVIDEQGELVPETKWQRFQVDPEFDRSGPVEIPPDQKERMLPLLRRTHVSFNNSSMVFRRELLTGQLRPAFEVTNGPDTFFLGAALFSPFGLYFDDRRTTRFRVYRSRPEWFLRVFRDEAQTSRQLATLFEERGMPAFAEWFSLKSIYFTKIGLAKDMERLIATRGSRRAALTFARQYLKFLSQYPRWGLGDRESVRTLVSSLAYVLSPSVTRAVGDSSTVGPQQS
jgi:glycosyltransferase involved in cell wall biosynthesis